ncbi:MAG: FKBP-type peptidyl-prolyl cis-trans isomerase [Bacteroidales bacterium]|nr:FKBP-type peptidyl-prolyl cis-trans isomerase [Bacteroidales bacterium]
MIIEKNKVVELSLTICLDSYEGEKIQEYTEDQPLIFIFGVGEIFPAFEDNIKGLKKGETFKFMLTPAQAFGEYDEKAIIKMKRNTLNLPIDEIFIGNIITFRSENGNELEGTILEFNNETITFDFNHPLAGENIYISGTVIDVRESIE